MDDLSVVPDRRSIRVLLAALFCTLLLSACGGPPRYSGHGQTQPKSNHRYCVHDHGCYRVFKTARGYNANGKASWYGLNASGKPTASGALFDPHASRIANKHLPFGTWVRITNTQNGRQAVAMVNDRGPFRHGRIIDATPGLARRLGYLQRGTAHVHVQTIPKSRLSAARRHAATVDQRLARRTEKKHHGHFVAEAGRFAVKGAFDAVTGGLKFGGKTSLDAAKFSGHIAGGFLRLLF